MISHKPLDGVLYYLHDPMCSWCWGFETVRAELMRRLPREIEVRRLLGGLAPDSDQPMPRAMQDYLRQAWRRIEQQIPGARFNFDFWAECAPRRSTWPACRAVIAAREQVVESERSNIDRRMTKAIQRAYYREARNPSDDDTLVALAGELGLDRSRFRRDLNAPATRRQLEREMALGRELNATSFPSLVLVEEEARWPIPLDYRSAKAMLKTILTIHVAAHAP